MLRALLWVEICTTWWWWLVILLPFALTRQFPAERTEDLYLLWLMPALAGLGIASGLRHRHGVRLALTRYGNPWHILVAKLVVPGVLMPVYYLIGQAAAQEVTDRAVRLGSEFYRSYSPSTHPAFLVPLFIAGLATGLRQARWWGTRFAPLAAVFALGVLLMVPLPWLWWNDVSLIMLADRWQWLLLMIGILTIFSLWWCWAALREAGGEDGPTNRTATAWAVALAGLGLVMAPWLYISERWDGLLRYVDSSAYFPALPLMHLHTSWANPLIAPSCYTHSVGLRLPDGSHLYFSKDGRRPFCSNKQGGPNDHDPLVSIRGTDGLDGTVPLSEAWTRLDLSPIRVASRWRTLRVAWFGNSGRVLQGGPPVIEDQLFLPCVNDPHWVHPSGQDGTPARLFQFDTWSGPELVLRPLTPADPPFLHIQGTYRIGIWDNRLTWESAHGNQATLPHPFSPEMMAAVAIYPGIDTNKIAIVYHWRPSPWSALRWQIVIVTRDGAVLTRTDLPTAENIPVVHGLSVLGSPAIAAIGLTFNRTGEEVTSRPWGTPMALLGTLVGGVIAVGLTGWILARRGMPWRARWGWLLAAALGGVAIPGAVLAVWFPASHRACPACGRRRYADDHTCPKCGSDWGVPLSDGRDLRDRQTVGDEP